MTYGVTKICGPWMSNDLDAKVHHCQTVSHFAIEHFAALVLEHEPTNHAVDQLLPSVGSKACRGPLTAVPILKTQATPASSLGGYLGPSIWGQLDRGAGGMAFGGDALLTTAASLAWAT